VLLSPQAEEFRTAVQMLLEWLSEAEQSLRFRGALPDDAEALQGLIEAHKVAGSSETRPERNFMGEEYCEIIHLGLSGVHEESGGEESGCECGGGHGGGHPGRLPSRLHHHDQTLDHHHPSQVRGGESMGLCSRLVVRGGGGHHHQG